MANKKKKQRRHGGGFHRQSWLRTWMEERTKRRNKRQEERTKRVEARSGVRTERVKAKGASGYWSPEAVQARQDTLATGIGVAGDLAATALTGGVSDLAGGLASSLTGEDGTAPEDGAPAGEETTDETAPAGEEEGGGSKMPLILGGVVVLVVLVVLVVAMSGKKHG